MNPLQPLFTNISSLFNSISTHNTHDYSFSQNLHNYDHHHDNNIHYDVNLLFPHASLVAALAVSYCRYTVKFPKETIVSRLLWSMVLAYLAYMNQDYWIMAAVHIGSFGQYFLSIVSSKMETTTTTTTSSTNNNTNKKKKESSNSNFNIQLRRLISVTRVILVTSILYGIMTYLIFSIFNPQHPNSFFSTILYRTIIQHSFILHSPTFSTLQTKLYNGLNYLIPISNVQKAYQTLAQFVEPSLLQAKINHLLFVTFHVQIGMGFLGITFLTAEQSRKNALIKIEDTVPKHLKKVTSEVQLNNTTPATNNNKNRKNQQTKHKMTVNESKNAEQVTKKFQKDAGWFIVKSALPYMIQIIFYGGLNMFAYNCFRDDLHRTIRLNGLFDMDGIRFIATAAERENYQSPGAYATHVETVVSTVYNMFNGKLFSVPKILLLPEIIARQPILFLKIMPLIFLSDFFKSSVVATLTNTIEKTKKRSKDIEAKRTRIEQFDIKNSELIQRSGYGSIHFTERRWVELTEEIQDLNSRVNLMARCRQYFVFLQRQFVMMALVDCALAKLITIGKLVSRDIFVYARAIEDTIDLLLMKSRAESELASMATAIETLDGLKTIWDESGRRALLDCSINDDNDSNHDSKSISIQDLTYSRGSAMVRIDKLQLHPGIYAVTGANGSGKSTLFRLLMGCDTNRKSIDLAKSINIESFGSLSMPSSDVVEISQNFYWPLFTKPVDWIYHKHLSDDVLNADERESLITRVETELRSLKFHPELQNGNANRDTTNLLRSDITEVKEDWFSDLSGGQKSKVELVRKVFLADKCPDVLLIDEAFAPLDPDSKTQVMQKLKGFCSESIVMVIYHADVGSDDEDEDCVQSSNFFNHNLHVEDGNMFLRPVCS